MKPFLVRNWPLLAIFLIATILRLWSQSALNPFFISGLTSICLFCLRHRRLSFIIISIILLANLSKLGLNSPQGYTMPANWNLPRAHQTAETIAQDVADIKAPNFNVTSTLDGDSRALPLRYLLEARFRTIPLGVESYPQAQVLYVLTRWGEKETLKHGLWEISSFSPQRIARTWPIIADIKLYRLEKL